MNVEQGVEWELAKEIKLYGKNSPHVISPQFNIAWLGIDPSPLRRKACGMKTGIWLRKQDLKEQW
jgi:hypothetical protein